MKTMDQHNHPVAKLLATIFGGIVGTFGYLKIHLGFDPSLWGTVLERAVSILGACFVAALTGFSAYTGTLLAKKIFKKGETKDSDE